MRRLRRGRYFAAFLTLVALVLGSALPFGGGPASFLAVFARRAEAGERTSSTPVVNAERLAPRPERSPLDAGVAVVGLSPRPRNDAGAIAPKEVIGLYYFRNRYLDPEQGRFVSRDPIGVWGDPGNLGNGYAFAGGNPVNGRDPFGLDYVSSTQVQLSTMLKQKNKEISDRAASWNPFGTSVGELERQRDFIQEQLLNQMRADAYQEEIGQFGLAPPVPPFGYDEPSYPEYPNSDVELPGSAKDDFERLKESARFIGLPGAELDLTPVEAAENTPDALATALQDNSGHAIRTGVTYGIEVEKDLAKSAAFSGAAKVAVPLFTGAAGAIGAGFKGGDHGREYLRRLLRASTSETEVMFTTNRLLGTRYVDVLKCGVAYEAKVGYVPYRSFYIQQALKDAWLVRHRKVDSVEWHFFKSFWTKKIGADPRLLALLRRNKIRVIIHEGCE